jgi:hypothetical protein
LAGKVSELPCLGDLEFANGGLEEDEDVAKERKRRGSVFQVSTGRSEREKRRRETSRV